MGFGLRPKNSLFGPLAPASSGIPLGLVPASSPNDVELVACGLPGFTCQSLWLPASNRCCVQALMAFGSWSVTRQILWVLAVNDEMGPVEGSIG
jgi:hypothetical protein